MGYLAGQEIMRCVPFVHVVTNQCLSIVCDYCMKSTNDEKITLKKCSKCKVNYYCGQNCQKNAWVNYHREECGYLSMAPSVPCIVRMIGRVVLKLNKGGSKEFATLPNGKKRHFQDLMSHEKEISKDGKRMEEFEKFYVLLQILLAEKLPEKDEVLRIYGRLLVNQLGINDNFGNIGVGLYLDASAIDHACDPNTVYISNGKQLILRCTREVNDFFNLRITYIQTLSDTTQNRRRALKEDYYFDCHCQKCQNVQDDQAKSSFICSQCCQGCVPVATKNCLECQFTNDGGMVQKHAKIVKKINLALSDKMDNDQALIELAQEAANVLHPIDNVYGKLLGVLFERCQAKNNQEKCLEFGKLIQMNLKHCNGRFDSNTINNEMTLAILSTNLNLLEEARLYLQNVKHTLEIAFGAEHSKVRVDCKKINDLIEKKRQMLMDNPQK